MGTTSSANRFRTLDAREITDPALYAAAYWRMRAAIVDHNCDPPPYGALFYIGRRTYRLKTESELIDEVVANAYRNNAFLRRAAQRKKRSPR